VTTPGLVSIVIVSYNNWPDIELAIESALHQSYESVEVIVVDNSSSDATDAEVPQRFGDAIRYLRQPNRGDSGAYNSGMQAANGEFIQFMDGDDVLAPNKIAKQVEVFRSNPEMDIVYGDIRRFESFPGTSASGDILTQPEKDMLMALLTPARDWAGLGALGALFRRKTIEKLGPWDETLYVSDLDYWVRAAWMGFRFAYCPGSPMGFYRIRPGQMTADISAMQRGIEAVWHKALGYVTKEPYRSMIARQLAQLRFHRAIAKDHMTTAESLAKLVQARSMCPEAISFPAYALGWITIAIPGGAAVANSPTLKAMRTAVARIIGYHLNCPEPRQYEPSQSGTRQRS
jgi:glycosyltransferase involved in cell wall biosynthesis